MSKAFTSEENEEEGDIDPPALPPGIKNYMTRAGMERMQAEASQLDQERRHLSGNELERQNRLKKIERRLRFLVSRLETAIAIDPTQQAKDRILFGATVRVK